MKIKSMILVAGVAMVVIGNLPSFAGGTCGKDCNNTFKVCKESEDALHKANQSACMLLPTDAERDLCQTQEKTRHDAFKEVCKDELNACKQAC